MKGARLAFASINYFVMKCIDVLQEKINCGLKLQIKTLRSSIDCINFEQFVDLSLFFTANLQKKTQ